MFISELLIGNFTKLLVVKMDTIKGSNQGEPSGIS